MFGKDANSWIDDRTKGNMQNDGNVPHWDSEPANRKKWLNDFLPWRHRRKRRFSNEPQVDVLMSVLDEKNLK